MRAHLERCRRRTADGRVGSLRLPGRHALADKVRSRADPSSERPGSRTRVTHAFRGGGCEDPAPRAVPRAADVTAPAPWVRRIMPVETRLLNVDSDIGPMSPKGYSPAELDQIATAIPAVYDALGRGVP